MKAWLKRGLLGLAVLAAALTLVVLAATRLEERRLDVPLPRDAAAARAPRLDPARLVQDLTTLASPELAGRRTGTAGGRKARALIEARFRELGLRPFGAAYAHAFAFTDEEGHRFADAANLVAWLPGTKTPDQYLVLSAHYDHLGERDGQLFLGADDNASGVSTLLALAAHFAAHPPAHSLIFAAFDAEELGIRGSASFVAAPPVPRERLVANLNLDMVGRQDARRVFVAGTHHWPALRPLVERAARTSPVAVHLGHDRPRSRAGLVDDWTDMSDHGRFHAAGIPFLYVGVEDHADYHGPGDTADRIDPGFFTGVAEFILDLALALDAGPLPSRAA